MKKNFHPADIDRIQALLLPAINAALRAGDEIAKVYQTDFSVEYKADHSPLTQADKMAHQVIVAELAPFLIPVLSEEGGIIPFSERAGLDLLWIVDPLDGTKEFIKKNGEFTVNIALIKDHSPVLGIIFQPVAGLLYFGCTGMGSYRIKDIISGFHVPQTVKALTSISQALPLPGTKDALVVCSSRSHLNTETIAYLNELKMSEGREITFLQIGSSLKFCRVAEGMADVYPRFSPSMEWDTAAGQAIAEQAGAQVLDCTTGMPLIYNREVLLNPSFLVQGPSAKQLPAPTPFLNPIV